jgi:HAD superfamily hydrolase (TIGR01509 family)
MDGTMLDSMPEWKNLAKNYLKTKGIEAPKNLNEKISAMSMTESAEYFRIEFGIKDSTHKIISDVNKLIEDKYKYEIPLKPYVKEYLSSLQRDDITMCVVTATPKELAEAALRRLDVLKYFSFVLCCDEVGVGKSKPDSYYLAVKKLGADIKDTAVFEDADYAIKTAKDAGFYTVGVYDEATKKTKEEIKMMCDWYIDSFKDIITSEVQKIGN